MEKFITATGKTIDLAIAAALEELHMDRDSVSVEVLENPRSGFLGIGAQPARVKVTYEAPDEAPKPALSSASRSKPKKPAESKPADSAKVIAPAAPKVIASAAPEAPRPQDTRASAPKAPRSRVRNAHRSSSAARSPNAATRSRASRSSPKSPLSRQSRRSTRPQSPAPRKSALKPSSRASSSTWLRRRAARPVKTADETYLVDLVGENLGILIGRRGETLDAIQHLTNYAVNRGQNKRVRINVDAESYRLKREQALRALRRRLRQGHALPPQHHARTDERL